VDITENATGKKVTLPLQETGSHTGIFTGILKTTPVGQPKEGALETAMNDTITRDL